MKTPGVGVVIVTHNSNRVLQKCVKALVSGDLQPDHIVVVDNHSADGSYLQDVERSFDRVDVVRLNANTGFCAGNNWGLSQLDEDLHVALINPDAFVSPSFLRQAVELLEIGAGAVGPKLLAADPETGLPTGFIDSAGIGQTRWGRFFDRGQGVRDCGQFDGLRDQPPALCAAALVLHRGAIRDIAPTGMLFDEKFFMYKEDLDLCFRLRRAGWRTLFEPSLTVLHCRGWKGRRSMPAWARRLSLTNEWRLWWRGWTPERTRWTALPYLISKSIAVGIGW